MKTNLYKVASLNLLVIVAVIGEEKNNLLD